MDTQAFNRIAVFIDADNSQASKIEDVLRDVSSYGRIVLKRAYANWSKPQLKPWEKEIKRFAIGTIQQFDFVSGKNASDMALTIDAMELLYSGNYDCFVIVSSDSDFTTLAIKIQATGTFVIGYGNKQTVESFRNACDEFNYLEDLAVKVEEEKVDEDEKTIGNGEDNEKTQPDQKVEIESSAISEESEEKEEKNGGVTEEQLNELLAISEEKYAGEDGYVNMAKVGQYIRRVYPDFNIKAFGYKKLSDYLRANTDRYEVIERGLVKLFKCKEPEE